MSQPSTIKLSHTEELDPKAANDISFFYAKVC